MPILNCRVFLCKFNDKGECRLESITLQDAGSSIIGRVICIEAEAKVPPLSCESKMVDKPVDLENIWGIPEKDLPGPGHKNHDERRLMC